jgi:hypothetical protein
MCGIFARSTFPKDSEVDPIMPESLGTREMRCRAPPLSRGAGRSDRSRDRDTTHAGSCRFQPPRGRGRRFTSRRYHIGSPGRCGPWNVLATDQATLVYVVEMVHGEISIDHQTNPMQELSAKSGAQPYSSLSPPLGVLWIYRGNLDERSIDDPFDTFVLLF